MIGRQVWPDARHAELRPGTRVAWYCENSGYTYGTVVAPPVGRNVTVRWDDGYVSIVGWWNARLRLLETAHVKEVSCPV